MMEWKYDRGLPLDIQKRFTSEKKSKEENTATKVFRMRKSAL